ncbi:MAG: hypothetical protein U0176_23480 [Bacteroidia bacterium]
MKGCLACCMGLLMLLLSACSPDVDVYAPEKESYVVYGVLNPKSSVQYVTITKVFQFEGDALLYAAQNDLTARGMRVQLISEDSTLTGTLVEMPDSMPGRFPLTTGVYAFSTVGAHKIVEGKRYDLRITKPDNANFLITAHTIVPTPPLVYSPSGPLYSEEHGTYSFPTIEFAKDQVVEWKTGSGMGYEVRVFVKYVADGVAHIAQWGPTAIQTQPEGCRSASVKNALCKGIAEGSVPRVLHGIFDDYPDTVDVYDTLRVAHSLDSLDRTAWVEVTCVDSALTYYLRANNPFGFGTNLLIDKPDYSNISGENTGIFGSYNTHLRYVFLGPCTRWMAGLREPRPPRCGE